MNEFLCLFALVISLPGCTKSTIGSTLIFLPSFSDGEGERREKKLLFHEKKKGEKPAADAALRDREERAFNPGC